MGSYEVSPVSLCYSMFLHSMEDFFFPQVEVLSLNFGFHTWWFS